MYCPIACRARTALIRGFVASVYLALGLAACDGSPQTGLVDDARLAALLNYVAVELAAVEEVSPFTEVEVASHRSSPFVDPLAARKDLLAHSLTASR